MVSLSHYKRIFNLVTPMFAKGDILIILIPISTTCIASPGVISVTYFPEKLVWAVYTDKV